MNNTKPTQLSEPVGEQRDRDLLVPCEKCGAAIGHPCHMGNIEYAVGLSHLRRKVAADKSKHPEQEQGEPLEDGGYASGFIDGRETGYHYCGSCEHIWEGHDGECKAYMPDGSICGCRKMIVTYSEQDEQQGALDAAWAKHCLVAYGEVVPLGKTMFRAGWQAAQSANTAAFNEGVEAATQWLIEDGRWPHGRTVQGIRALKRTAPKKDVGGER